MPAAFSWTPTPSSPGLPIADQQKIEILRALARDARIIVMDEPTSSLSRDEVTQLHSAMRTLRDEGRSIIYVSHFLHDILEVSDRITVLRDGKHVKTAPAKGETRSSLVAAMLGGGKSETPVPAQGPPRESGARAGSREPGERAGGQRREPLGGARRDRGPHRPRGQRQERDRPRHRRRGPGHGRRGAAPRARPTATARSGVPPRSAW